MKRLSDLGDQLEAFGSAVDFEDFAAISAWLWPILRVAGYIAMSGQIVDASLIAAPRQRNTQAEKRAIKGKRCL